MPPQALATQVRTNWNHNNHFHEYLLRQLPNDCVSVLDVGCGNGGFALRLAQRGHQVVAIDFDPAAVARAQSISRGLSNLRFVVADIMAWPRANCFDCVTLVASLHHLSAGAGLIRAAELLRPGGRLIVLGIFRQSHDPVGVLRSAASVVASRFLRVVRNNGSTAAGMPHANIMPVTDTLRGVRSMSLRTLPGARVREHLFWRYSLIWDKPC